MKFYSLYQAGVSAYAGAILALGFVIYYIRCAYMEPMNPAIDLAWVTVIICSLPLLINSVQSILDHLEIHANFLIVIAMVALYCDWRLPYGGLCRTPSYMVAFS